MTKYGYARVSTAGQDLDTQIETLIKQGCKEQNIFAEKFTGTKTKQRKELQALLDVIKPGDELIVTKLDRLGRKTADIIKLIDELLKQGIVVNVLSMGRLDNSPSGKLMTTVVLAFAEFERDMIVQRTTEGKAYARKHNKNFKEGRPKRKITDRYRKIYEYKQTHTYKETEQMCGVSRSTIQRIVKQIEEDE